jgi:hypothetical protein
MIPRKTTKYSWPPEGYAAMTSEEKKAALDKANSRPPLTELQKLAQKENFALFQLASVKSQLYSIQQFDLKDNLVRKELDSMRDSLEFLKTYIKSIQSDRAIARRKKK